MSYEAQSWLGALGALAGVGCIFASVVVPWSPLATVISGVGTLIAAALLQRSAGRIP